MTYQFQGHAQLFNGKYYGPKIPVRVKATNLSVAIAKGMRLAMKSKKKGTRIEAATITLERLGQVIDDHPTQEPITSDQAMRTNSTDDHEQC